MKQLTRSSSDELQEKTFMDRDEERKKNPGPILFYIDLGNRNVNRMVHFKGRHCGNVNNTFEVKESQNLH